MLRAGGPCGLAYRIRNCLGPEAGDDQETERLEALETSANDEQRARHEAQRDHLFDMIRAELGPAPGLREAWKSGVWACARKTCDSCIDIC